MEYFLLIFRKNFWVTMMDMKTKRRLDDGKFYVEKKHRQTKKEKIYEEIYQYPVNLNFCLKFVKRGVNSSLCIPGFITHMV